LCTIISRSTWKILWVAVTIDVPRLARDIERIVGEMRLSEE
jgi:hypothetical protein